MHRPTRAHLTYWYSFPLLWCCKLGTSETRSSLTHQGSPPISGILTRQAQGMCSPPHQNGQCEKNLSDRETSPLLSSTAEYVLTDRKPHYLFPSDVFTSGLVPVRICNVHLPSHTLNSPPPSLFVLSLDLSEVFSYRWWLRQVTGTLQLTHAHSLDLLRALEASLSFRKAWESN